MSTSNQTTPSLAKSFLAILLSISMLQLVACGAKDGAAEQEEVKGVIPQAQLDALEKAKAVEDVLSEAEEKRRQTLEQ